ncbi:hypothetical protein AB4Z40_27250 [Bosea sp. 2YAB26]|uniref:hypothetical protein n=1 Tax=Bosea sp. 2YAB26 TaxID=3237478 RepID=UPI003F91286E
MYVLVTSDGCYVRKDDSMISFVSDPHEATRFPTREAASEVQPGDGTGFQGRVVMLTSACLVHESRLARR